MERDLTDIGMRKIGQLTGRENHPRSHRSTSLPVLDHHLVPVLGRLELGSLSQVDPDQVVDLDCRSCFRHMMGVDSGADADHGIDLGAGCNSPHSDGHHKVSAGGLVDREWEDQRWERGSHRLWGTALRVDHCCCIDCRAVGAEDRANGLVEGLRLNTGCAAVVVLGSSFVVEGSMIVDYMEDRHLHLHLRSNLDSTCSSCWPPFPISPSK